MLFIIIGILAFIGCIIGIVIFVKSRQDEINDYYNAAQSIIKENQLDEFLKNPYNKSSQNNRNAIKYMVFLKFKDKSKSKYVFDLEKEVYIGRDKEQNQVCVNEPVVSHRHCRLFTNGSSVFVQDLNSANGFELHRRLSNYVVASGGATEVFSGDVLKIGTTKIKITVFTFNSALM